MPQTLPVFKKTSVRLTNLKPGKYQVELWDTWKGVILAQSEIPSDASTLTIPLPEFRCECAVKVKLVQ